MDLKEEQCHQQEPEGGMSIVATHWTEEKAKEVLILKKTDTAKGNK